LPYVGGRGILHIWWRLGSTEKAAPGQAAVRVFGASATHEMRHYSWLAVSMAGKSGQSRGPKLPIFTACLKKRLVAPPRRCMKITRG
jgi:hypothetical protein